ncbi:MAG: dihydroorotase [Bdellovibrionaceae bacterium]|nr:dihydroorotase [Pseudobdellovibrionaceae bacterium]
MEHFDLLLKNAHVVLPLPQGESLGVQQLDLGLKDGRIAAIGPRLAAEATEILDLTGLHVLPGVIDSQVHMREPGLEHKEDLETGTRGALLGGITSVFEMPNTNPSTTTRAAFEEKLRRAAGRCHTNYAFFIGGSPDNVEQLAELEIQPHCAGIKVFMGSSTGTLLVEEDVTLERILRAGRRRVIVHCEDEARLKERKHLAVEGAHARFHPVWRDELTALRATQRLLALARKTSRPVHVLHVTSAEEMDFLKTQKDIATVEVLPQHLTLEAPECYERLGTLAQMNPPIRDGRHRERLWKAVLDGTVDVLGSDHAPHTLEEKSKTYPQSPSGFPGTQTLVTLMLDHVNAGRLPLTRFVELVGEGPRRVFGLESKGRIAVGADADLTVVDLKKTRRIENKWIASRAGWTPFDGLRTTGWPVMAVLGGRIAMREDEILLPHSGKAVDFTSGRL